MKKTLDKNYSDEILNKIIKKIKILTNGVKAFNQNENQCKDLFEKLIIYDDIVK